jgi:signal transduction histidine kinase
MEFAELAALTIHDVKNRLHGLAVQAESSGHPQLLQGALAAAASLTRLLVWYKAEKGVLQPEVEARVPEDLLRELAAEVARQTTLTLSIDVSEAPTLWYYDESLVRMVLLDALYNALRHARQTIRLTAVERGAWLELTVQDDGPGYPAGLLGSGPEMRPLSREGTGLGLHLAGRVAALHANAGVQGTIELKNEAGAVFCLRLPQ